MGQKRLEHCAHIARDGQGHLADLVQFGRIGIDMDHRRVGAESLDLAGGTIIKACACHDEQIGFFHNQVGVPRPMHAEHAQGERVIVGQHTQRHQGHGGGQG